MAQALREWALAWEKARDARDAELARHVASARPEPEWCAGRILDGGCHLPAAQSATDHGYAVEELLAFSKRQFVNHGQRKDIRNVISGQRLVALPLERRDHAPCCAVPICSGLRVSKDIRQQLRMRVGQQHIQALGVALFHFELE